VSGGWSRPLYQLIPALLLCDKLGLAHRGCSASDDTAAKSDQPPNIIAVLIDDTGFADFGAYGSEISTPNIDRLAVQGVQFTNFHAAVVATT
jgi:hypothetical protein